MFNVQNKLTKIDIMILENMKMNKIISNFYFIFNFD